MLQGPYRPGSLDVVQVGILFDKPSDDLYALT